MPTMNVVLTLAALRWVNEFRKYELNLPPLEGLPRGVPRDPNSCPVARALDPGGDFSVSSLIASKKTGMTWLAPPAVCDFLAAFDQCRIPELIEEV